MDGFANALVRGVLSLWIVAAGLCAQALLALVGTLPQKVALGGGILVSLFGLPSLWVLALGILGLPSTWMAMLVTFGRLGKHESGGPLARLVLWMGQIYQVLVFRPFSCPSGLRGLPDALKVFLFRDPERMIPPPAHQQRHAVVPKECWILVNGVATPLELARDNAEQLYQLFGRPVWICYNPTDGILVDLLECLVDKLKVLQGFWETRPRRTLEESLRQALAKADTGDYTRVVLVAHSQGTIITAAALRSMLQGDRRTKEQSRKFLEVYCIAGCAHQLVVKDAYGVQMVKYLETIANQRDTVAWLGALFPLPKFWQDRNGQGIIVQGNLVTDPDRWGHLLNTHYLDPLREGAYPTSRLHSYRNGRIPDGAIEYALQQRLAPE